ncbi:hypothetical protein LUW75_15940 [Streptomyces sp. MRC013]|uniref:hypothetical protein n=1 Tax=Streptomyces sp. MRC013 TaxID=2898276 RepID=UPI0020266EF7|nr:hypothetical protein [Streptomyces sp. MRC013]URM91220.1 hypothetical protein LUW75_15940 [Streptomyces sp. MRC013]
MTRRTDGNNHSPTVAMAVPVLRTQDRAMPAYASSSQDPDGRTVRAVQQKNAAMRV